MDEIDVPQYFLCPISLQIMKDPVTTAAGITYDRESIQQWLTSAAACPVTKQPLTLASELTPNHMLRRLIQAWCVANANIGVDRIPTPKSPLHRSFVVKLIRDVNRNNNINSIKKLDELAGECVKNQQCMAESGVAKAMILFIMRCFNKQDYNNNKNNYLGIEEALRILQLTWTPTDENKNLVEDHNLDFIKSILWVLKIDIPNSAKTHALMVLKDVVEVAGSNLVSQLELDFFEEMMIILRRNNLHVKVVLQILIQTCSSSSGRNRARIVEAGAIFAAIEIELSNNRPSEKKVVSELVFRLLAELCSCADGRQQFLRHAGGVAVAAKRLLRVSPATDDRVMYVFESIARFSATEAVVAEMLRVGAVSKLCMVMQADCAGYLKKKAREILRLHSNSWSNSPCIQVYLLTMNPR